MKAYWRSKLALVLFTYELARRLDGTEVTANCCHPGRVATNIWGRALGPAAFVGKVSRPLRDEPAERPGDVGQSYVILGGRGRDREVLLTDAGEEVLGRLV